MLLLPQLGFMSNGVCLPASLVQPHMPEIADMAAGSSCSIKLQLVLLPPFAADITPGGHSLSQA
jgi:hypothetical protein